MSTVTGRSVAHHSFTLTRDFPVPVAKAFQAFADPVQKAAWFGTDEGFDTHEQHHDFRVGGRETSEGQWHGGPTSRFEATYTDIIENERIVLTYDMWVDGRHISTSLVAYEFEATASGTRFTHAEHGVHLDGFDDGSQREQGTGEILNALVSFLTSERNPA